jgi:hypothetical protein
MRFGLRLRAMPVRPRSVVIRSGARKKESYKSRLVFRGGACEGAEGPWRPNTAGMGVA